MAAFRALVPPCRNDSEHSKNLAICVHACVVIVLATCHGCLDITANVVRPCHTPDHTYEKFRRALKIVTSVHQPFGSRRRRGINKRSRCSTHLWRRQPFNGASPPLVEFAKRLIRLARRLKCQTRTEECIWNSLIASYNLKSLSLGEKIVFKIHIHTGSPHGHNRYRALCARIVEISHIRERLNLVDTCVPEWDGVSGVYSHTHADSHIFQFKYTTLLVRTRQPYAIYNTRS